MDGFNKSYTGLRLDLLRHVKGNNLSILDIGCATGANAEFLRNQKVGSYFEGIEIDSEMAALAKQNMDKVIVGDIEEVSVFDQISERSFDVILIGDVLEHLRNPWRILGELATKLKSQGIVIFSVPNIRHIDVFIHVFLKGYWPYNERGIFDKTHIRMFTKHNILELIDFANLSLIDIDRNYRYRDAIGSKFPFYGGVLKALFPDLYTFQFVVVCEKR
ncbi:MULTISPECIES: class I SAM-dependent methyltransferase [Methylocaldum]|jgi:2-polyprenyl-3-methyl-5-hydroxy-6-metoxy-1,4-benzoquinol methylase|uniref:class I SAM-dependent methyltransferase n=1 Tax=unclassified Methylocaldum TaxID=2622260 RepID=UPI00098A345A|nr:MULTISPECIES: class I SAM-dependent methyltransferase [unclassified Methylocaldum]MBP1150029.1 2-polyprenyl-3-methyl-5-hydroxy-6-metoxy-1,4-benzoquinol methylase [Methylocaldum sp. RMAD-M]MVF23243.1 class I SAM-dependent methyltransferase [Methylocaldum sp. BRCS4]